MPFLYSIAAWLIEKLIGGWWKPKLPESVVEVQAIQEAKPDTLWKETVEKL